MTDVGGMVSYHGSQRVGSDLKVTTTTGVEQMWHPSFCLPIHRTDRTQIPSLVMIVDERETTWRKSSSNELSMGPENKDSRSWNEQMGCWIWLSCMNALPPSRLAQNQQEWHRFFIWVMDGQSWPVSGQKRKDILFSWQIHTLMNVFYGRKLL